MVDGISFKMDISAFTAGIAQRQARMPAAAEWAVRQTGRTARSAAQAAAPVLTTATGDAIPGLLRDSIRATKDLRQDAGTFSLTVGPRGDRVYLYAQKEERRSGYMAAGGRAAQAAFPAIAQAAFDIVWRGA